MKSLKLIRLTAAAMAAACILTSAAQVTAAGSTEDKYILYGDLNLDGRLDIMDAELMTELLSGENNTYLPDKQAQLRSDVNADGRFDAKDAELTYEIIFGKSEAPARRHKCSWKKDEYVEPTCTFAGHNPWHCTKCGIIYYEAVKSAEGHSWKRKIIHPATCTERGYAEYVCGVCGGKYITEYKDAAGHDFKETDKVEANCLIEGYTEYTCSVCGEVKRDLFAEAGTHDMQLKILQDGGRQTAYYVCVYCGEKVKAPEELQPAQPKPETPEQQSGAGEGDETEEPAPPTIPQAVDYNNDGIFAVDEYLGAGDIVEYLTEHYNDYIYTRYVSIRDNYRDPHRCLHPKGLYPNSPGLNCTGFVASVFENAGGDLSRVPNRAAGTGMSGDYANGYNWRNMVNMAGITVYRFSTIREALKSGKMRKGDVIYFQPKYRGDDCHMGIFWGDTPYDDKIFHSIAQGCVVTNIKCAQAYAYMWVIPITHS